MGMQEEHEKLLLRAKELETENVELKARMANVRTERELLIEKVTKIIEKVEKVEV
jgi:predicted nuclease with TOPRIM domain